MRALNAFATCCKGQRMGIFSGSGVGKSTLLAMLARNTNADAIVIGLIGERGREVKEFIEDDLGDEGLTRTVVVAATSDEAPLVRRQAAYVAMTVAEQLRDQGLNVLLLMDSVTRFAMAQREIGLSAGEPPASKGYTPTVFAELPRLLERAGPGLHGGSGSITGLFTVLVEGDDHNEPISDAVRGILDGHIVLDRAIAERGRFPAINILKSVSRAMPGCNSEEEQSLVLRARAPMTIYEDMAELIRLGAYKAGTNPEVDNAVRLHPQLEAFLAQKKDEQATLSEGYAALSDILDGAGKGGRDEPDRYLLRLKRFRVDEMKRRIATIDAMKSRSGTQALRSGRQCRARKTARRRFRHRPAGLSVLPALHRSAPRKSAHHAEGNRARARHRPARSHQRLPGSEEPGIRHRAAGQAPGRNRDPPRPVAPGRNGAGPPSAQAHPARSA